MMVKNLSYNNFLLPMENTMLNTCIYILYNMKYHTFVLYLLPTTLTYDMS